MSISAAYPPPLNALETLFQALPDKVNRILMLGAIPHRLDPALGRLLFQEHLQDALDTIQQFNFITFDDDNLLEYHVLARRYLLELWQAQAPEEFRTINQQLADEYFRRLKENPSQAEPWAEEWLYHLVAASPAEGLARTSHLLHEYIESQELGAAERLVRFIREQEHLLAKHQGWLDYFSIYLDFSQYKQINQDTLEKLAQEAADSMLGGCVQRLIGRVAIRAHRWEVARIALLRALDIFKQHDSLANQALTHLDLGDLYMDVVESSGGILLERREFKSRFHAALYVLVRVPLLLYRFFAERINGLPNLYGMNFQNWVSLRLLRLALLDYRAAEKKFDALHNQRGVAETRLHSASVLLTLSYNKSATTLTRIALKDKLVGTSPYYSAQAFHILGQASFREGQLAQAREYLRTSLQTFEEYLDWGRAARSALELGQVHESSNQLEYALQSYAKGLLAAGRCQDFLVETEIHRRLGRIIQEAAHQPELNGNAINLRASIKRLTYIDRYTGVVATAFQRLSYRLVFPFVALFIIAVIVGAGISVQFVEGELRIPDLPPIVWSKSFDLLAGLLLPFLMVWGYHIAYALLGQLILWRMPFKVLDEAQRDIFILDDQGLHQLGKGIDRKVDWTAVRTLSIDNRALYDRPLMFSSRTVLYDDFETAIPASTFHYSELISEIKNKLRLHNPRASVSHQELSLLRTYWLWIALLVGLTIALSMVGGIFIDPFFGCYQKMQECPPEYRLYIQPIVQFALFFASLFFMIVCWIRWKLQSHRVSLDARRKINK